MRPSRPLTVEIRGWCLLTWILTHISVMWQQLLQVHSTWMWSVWCVFNPSSGFILPYISITIPLARSSSSDLPDFSLTLGLFPFLSSLTTVGSGSRWKTWTWWEPLTGRRNPRQACVCVCVICPVVTTTEGLSVCPHNWKASQCLGRYDDIIRFTFTSSTHRPSASTWGVGDLWADGSDGSKIQLKVQPHCFKSSKVYFQLFLHPILVILCELLLI